MNIYTVRMCMCAYVTPNIYWTLIREYKGYVLKLLLM